MPSPAELPELKTLGAVQRLAEQLPQTPAPARLLVGGGDDAPGLTRWLQRYQAGKQWDAAAQVDKVR